MAAIPSHAKPASTWATYSFQNQHPSGKMTIRVNRKWSSEHTLSQFCLGSSLAGGVNHLPGWPTITHSAHAPRLSLHVFIYLWFTLLSIKSQAVPRYHCYLPVPCIEEYMALTIWLQGGILSPFSIQNEHLHLQLPPDKHTNYDNQHVFETKRGR